MLPVCWFDNLYCLYCPSYLLVLQFGADFHDLSRLADLATSLTSGESAALQAVLEQLSVPERCEGGAWVPVAGACHAWCCRLACLPA